MVDPGICRLNVEILRGSFNISRSTCKLLVKSQQIRSLHRLRDVHILLFEDVPTYNDNNLDL